MAPKTRTYGLTDPIPEEIPAGCERITLVTEDRSGRGFFQIEKPGGEFYVCDADGDVLDLHRWTFQRVLADVPEGDSDAFFEALEGTAKRVEKEIEVAISRCGQGGTYGERMGLAHPDLHPQLRSEIEEEILRGQESGQTTVAGQPYRWWIEED
jgi:hypothetical protein